MPIFREVSFGGSAGAGRLKMSLASFSQDCFATGRGIAGKYLILTEVKRCFTTETLRHRFLIVYCSLCLCVSV